MKKRRHHNNEGLRHIKQGQCIREIKRIARKYNIPINYEKPLEKYDIRRQHNE